MANCYHTDDNIEGMDTVSLQAVTLVDGSTAYIQHSPKGIKSFSSVILHVVDNDFKFSAILNIKSNIWFFLSFSL